MTDTALKTLFYPYHSGILRLPQADERVLFLGAEPGIVLPDGWASQLIAVQGFRPHFNAMVRAGFETHAECPDGVFDHSLILCGKHRGHNDALFASALLRTRPGGTIVIAGDKMSGSGSFARRLSGLFSVIDRQSKYHGVVFWLERPQHLDNKQIEFTRLPDRGRIDGRYSAAPGMFSHNRVDPASELLAHHLPADLTGRVADFASGWGYLSVQLKERCSAVTAIDLYEADYAALQAAKENLALVRQGVAIDYHWHDLIAEPVERRYDAIVMNPPFHQGRTADPNIGQAMIRVAVKALEQGGRLFVVANRHLPYEKVLEQEYLGHGRLADEAGFKVLWGRRR